jgi:hypothetical protein
MCSNNCAMSAGKDALELDVGNSWGLCHDRRHHPRPAPGGAALAARHQRLSDPAAGRSGEVGRLRVFLNQTPDAAQIDYGFYAIWNELTGSSHTSSAQVVRG